MATLAAQIEADLLVLEEDQTVKDLTNKRSSNAATNATLLTKACEHAAAVVARFLGISLTSASGGDDTQAVQLGVEIAQLKLRNTHGGELRAEAEAAMTGVLDQLRELRDMRRDEEAGFVIVGPDRTAQIVRYPAAAPEDVDPEEVE